LRRISHRLLGDITPATDDGKQGDHENEATSW
jgi:hypothetical protein